MVNRICAVPDCDRPHYAHGYCRLHGRRARAGTDMAAPSRAADWADRFLYRVDMSGDCWIWTGYTNRGGYGEMHVGGGWVWLAHRLSYALHYGDLPAGAHICHRCDNPPCVNPRHLYVGTPATNTADKIERGRANAPNGEKHPWARLTAEQVVKIRADHAAGATTVALAREYGVRHQSIAAIIHRWTWKHVP